jgi:hypothetical protein
VNIDQLLYSLESISLGKELKPIVCLEQEKGYTMQPYQKLLKNKRETSSILLSSEYVGINILSTAAVEIWTPFSL